MNRNLVIVLVVAVIAALIIFVVMQNKKATAPKPAIVTSPFNSFGFNFPSFGGSGSTSASSQPVTYTGTEDVINGMTRDEYLAAGYTQDEVNAIFNYRPAK